MFTSAHTLILRIIFSISCTWLLAEMIHWVIPLTLPHGFAIKVNFNFWSWSNIRIFFSQKSLNYFLVLTSLMVHFFWFFRPAVFNQNVPCRYICHFCCDKVFVAATSNRNMLLKQQFTKFIPCETASGKTSSRHMKMATCGEWRQSWTTLL